MLVFFSELIRNHILIVGVVSWLIAQVIKTVIYAAVNHKVDFSRLTGDGGMPSCHSATVTSVAVMSGLQVGFSSPVFAIACIFAIVVMHDAMGVRLETGKQAQVINEMFELLDRLSEESLSMDVKLKEFVGHTPTQVLAGSVLGIIVAVCSYNYF